MDRLAHILFLSASLLVMPCFAHAMDANMDSVHISQDTLTRGDTTYIITTVCAPVCSSIVKAYNATWLPLSDLTSPYPHAVFPEAYIQDGHILWRDNTPSLYDEEEKKHLLTE